MKSTIPWTSACSSRLPTGASRQERSSSRFVASPWTVDGEGDEPVGRVGPAVEDDVLDVLEQVGRDVLVDDELAGVDDAHVEPGPDRVVEERGVHRLAHDVVAAEREREVRDAAARARARAALLDQRQRLDERLREAVVLLDPGRDGEHVRVEDDVLRREAVADEQVVGAAADLDLALDRVGLALLVERHHDDAGAVAPDPARLLEERLLALLEADRVDDPLALDALEPGLEHGEARAVDHDRDPRDLGLGRDQVEERRHRLLAVEQVGVHVHVEDVRAAAHLLERDVDGALVVVRLDQPAEARGAGDVRALADHHEAGVRADLERLEAAEARPRRPFRDLSRGLSLDHVRDRPMCSGVVPQQPPTTLTKPSRANSPSSSAVSCGSSS